MSRCVRCGGVIDAFCNYPCIVFCCVDCREHWLANAVTQDVRALRFDGGVHTYGAEVVDFKRFGKFHYFKWRI